MISPFVIERTINAPVSLVWKAISDREMMKNWYFDLVEFLPVIGFEFSFTGGPAEDRQYVHLCRVNELKDGQKLGYSWNYQGYEGGSQVSFELSEAGHGKTHIKLIHAGLETFPASNEDFARSNFEAGWGDLIGRSLPEFLEKYQGSSPSSASLRRRSE